MNKGDWLILFVTVAMAVITMWWLLGHIGSHY